MCPPRYGALQAKDWAKHKLKVGFHVARARHRRAGLGTVHCREAAALTDCPPWETFQLEFKNAGKWFWWTSGHPAVEEINLQSHFQVRALMSQHQLHRTVSDNIT
jgi:hypothetical protein